MDESNDNIPREHTSIKNKRSPNPTVIIFVSFRPK